MRRRGATALAGAVVMFVVAVLSGCSGLPDHGDVKTNNATGSLSTAPNIRVLARTPRAGATPTEIVAGFLTASASFEADHAFARSYLTTAASKAWRPDAGVAVYNSDPGYQLAELGPNKVRMLALRSAGTITARGQFNQPTGDSQYRANFTVRKVGAQWRIADLPAGLILSTGDVARAYRSVNLFFLDVAGGVLVPDPLFLPAQQVGIATVLTRQLLFGPTAWLAPAVRTAVPAGTRLAVDSVPVEDGIARVDLDRAAVAASGDERRALAAQLTYTLGQLPDVRAVRITLNGVPFAIPGAGAVTSVSDWESFDPDAAPLDSSTYAVDQGHLASVGTAAFPVPGYFGTVKSLKAAAVALDGQLYAGVLQTGAGNDVRIGPVRAATATLAYRGRFVTSVSFDRLNSAWIADRADARTTVWAVRANGSKLQVRVEGLGSRSIQALRVSRDGARIALVVAASPGASGTLLLGRIERATGVPVVAGLRRVENTLTDVDDVAWADDTTLLVAARRVAESVQSFVVGIDGDSVVGAGSVPSMLTVAASPGQPKLAGAGNDTLWIERGNGWRIFVSATTPIYPG